MQIDDARKLAAIMSNSDDFVEMDKLIEPLNEAFPHLRFWMQVEDDYGKVIGRGGRTANALRTVLKAAAVREERRVLIDIVD
jgi:predicted RNA-binding protein YlqC (UPF0109 family)